ncbi:hypothetical protein ACQEVS_02070 [Streptomyces sp. CA-181903]|uniref:hypothetical protein n=1 Tax=Streptomyces sp. CA-181903 TaxID=3240055 RepID=UPI003D917212
MRRAAAVGRGPPYGRSCAVGLRSGAPDPTLAGTCAAGTFRLVAPVLSGLAAVAVRSRARR